MTTFNYEGRVYVRPIGRGTVLIDHDGDSQLEDVLTEGFGYLRVEFVSYEYKSASEQAAKDALRRKHALAPQGGKDES